MNLLQLKSILKEAGASNLLVKPLSPNDNSKNQIYLGMGFQALNLLTFGALVPTPGKAILKARMPLVWLNDTGRRYPAPEAQLILYPQYPEVRLSGLLKGCEWAPSDIMNSRATGRLLFLGVTESGETLAYAAGADSLMVREFDEDTTKLQNGVFWVAALRGTTDLRSELLRELSRIHCLDWIESKRLSASGVVSSCDSSNCGGCTLEAELGIPANSKSEPDFKGFEVKSYGVRTFRRAASSPITLMTPEPTGGFYKEFGVPAFVTKYGYADRAGRENRRNFGGRYISGREVVLTGLTMRLDGYNASSGKLEDPTKGIALIDRSGDVAAYWPYLPLIDHWIRKHSATVFVPSEHRKAPANSYRYGSRVTLAKGTDFMLLLNALAAGHVYYDPAIKIIDAPGVRPAPPKRRSQFRVSFHRISSLYHSVEIINL